MFHADLHIHSKFSRACSKDCEIPNLAWWAARKGVTVVGTGDFTHPAWAAQLAESLVPGGSLVVVTMTVPGSIAAAHLHLMLVTQAGRAALPSGPEISSDLGQAGLEVVTDEVLVPSEPFVAVRAVRR